MLVIANGAAKCGSTWLTYILLRLVNPKPLPAEYADLSIPEIPVIDRSKLKRFLTEVDFEHEHYVSKNHFFYERDLLSRHRHVYAFDITRNLADALVSMYFHSRARQGLPETAAGGLSDVYWKSGADKVKQLVRYHAVWSVSRPWIYVSSYERLKRTPADEIARMASFLGLRVTQAQIERIVEETRFDTLKASIPVDSRLQVRFRKGAIGEHKTYVAADVLRDIARIEAENARYPQTLPQKVDFAVRSFLAATR